MFTDLPDSASSLIDLLSKVNTDEIVSIRFMPYAPEFAGTPTSYIADWTEDRYPIPDRDFIAQTVATALSLPPLEAIATLDLQPLEAVCGELAPVAPRPDRRATPIPPSPGRPRPGPGRCDAAAAPASSRWR